MIDNFPHSLSKEQLYELFKKYKSGDKLAREKIIKHNIRLVMYCIYNKFNNLEHEQEDLFSIGLLGLIKSVDSFDLDKNFQFSTYATKCINNEIASYIRDNIDNKTISLDEPIGDSTTTLSSFIEDDRKDIMVDFEKKQLYNEIISHIDDLSKLESKIVKLYFGLEDGNTYNCLEISRKLNISRQYAYRVLKMSVKKLRRFVSDDDFNIKNHTIYDYFNNYTREQVDEILNALMPSDYALLSEIYNRNIKYQFRNRKVDRQLYSSFYGSLLPKIKKLLYVSYGKNKK